MKSIALLLIVFYQHFISPTLGNNCRFYPRCSEYFKEAIEKSGAAGVWKGFARILRCHPFHGGGLDLYPD